MLWNAPIWVSEIIVSGIKLIIGVLPLFFCIAFVGIVFSFTKFLIYKRKNNRKVIDFIKSPYIVIILGCLVAACAVFILFYLPQEVMPNKYEFDQISITTMNESSLVKSDPITIKDKESLNDFKNMFHGYKCRRDLDTGETALNSDVIFIDLIVFENGKNSPLHFVVKQNSLKRYTSANTDFIYIIEDKENLLANKIFEYAKKYKK